MLGEMKGNASKGDGGCTEMVLSPIVHSAALYIRLIGYAYHSHPIDVSGGNKEGLLDCSLTGTLNCC